MLYVIPGKIIDLYVGVADNIVKVVKMPVSIKAIRIN